MDKSYETPVVKDYGDLQEITANNQVVAFVDVPQGTPVTNPIDVVGDEADPGMS